MPQRRILTECHKNSLGMLNSWLFAALAGSNRFLATRPPTAPASML
jgi:hypothetical protein